MSRLDANQSDQNPGNRPQGRDSFDPYLYASLLGAGNAQNPFQVFAGEWAQKITTVINLRQNMQAARDRLSRMQSRIDRVQGDIAEVNKKDTGHRLNRLR